MHDIWWTPNMNYINVVNVHNYYYYNSDEVLPWLSVWTGARCIGPADATATPSPIAPVKSRMVYLFGASLPRLSRKKRPLNGSSSSSSSTSSSSYHYNSVCVSINRQSSPTCVLFHADADNDKIGDSFDGVVWNVDLTALWSVANAFHRRRLTRQTLRHHLTCHQYTAPWNIFFRWLIITKRDYYTLSGEVLAWLSVCSEVQMICIWSSWCHCHPIISWYSNIQHKQSHTAPQSFQAFSKSSAGNKCYCEK